MYQFSRLVSFEHVGGLRHLAESVLVSDLFSWPTSELIARLCLLTSIKHWHRCERLVSQDTKEALNSPCIFNVLRFPHPNHFCRKSLRVCPQTSHNTFLFTRFQTGSEPQRCCFIVSKSQKIPPYQTDTPFSCRRPHCDSVEPDDIETPLPRAPLPYTTRV